MGWLFGLGDGIADCKETSMRRVPGIAQCVRNKVSIFGVPHCARMDQIKIDGYGRVEYGTLRQTEKLEQGAYLKCIYSSNRGIRRPLVPWPTVRHTGKADVFESEECS